MKICIAQMDLSLGEPEKNFAAAESWINRAGKEHPDAVVLPEMWNTGYALEKVYELGDREGEQVRRRIAPLAQKWDTSIVAGSLANRRGEKVYNTMSIFDRRGQLLGEYDKVHLFQLMEEHRYLAPGDHVTTFNLEGFLCGGVICYDIRFPELIRTLALEGTQVLFVSAQWPHPRLNHWRQLLIARAIENQMFVVACNRVGQEGKATFFGHSMVIDPWGEILGELEEEEGLLSVEIDPAAVEKARRKIPVFADRRPGLYGCCE